MSRIYKLYLQDILKAIERIDGLAMSSDGKALTEDQLRFDGVLFNLMTIGEAVKNIPEEIKTESPDINWRNIARFRDHLVHHYFQIERDIVLAIIEYDLAPLRAQVEVILRDLEDEE